MRRSVSIVEAAPADVSRLIPLSECLFALTLRQYASRIHTAKLPHRRRRCGRDRLLLWRKAGALWSRRAFPHAQRL